MIKLKTEKNDRLTSDGQYLTNGCWIADLDKLPLGELFKDKLDIICGGSNQLSLDLDEPKEATRDYSSLIPTERNYELIENGIVYKHNNGATYKLFLHQESGVMAWINQKYLGLFDDVKVTAAHTKGHMNIVEFVDEEDEFVFGVCPFNFEEQSNFLYEVFKKNVNVITKSKMTIVNREEE